MIEHVTRRIRSPDVSVRILMEQRFLPFLANLDDLSDRRRDLPFGCELCTFVATFTEKTRCTTVYAHSEVFLFFPPCYLTRENYT